METEQTPVQGQPEQQPGANQFVLSDADVQRIAETVASIMTPQKPPEDPLGNLPSDIGGQTDDLQGNAPASADSWNPNEETLEVWMARQMQATQQIVEQRVKADIENERRFEREAVAKGLPSLKAAARQMHGAEFDELAERCLEQAFVALEPEGKRAALSSRDNANILIQLAIGQAARLHRANPEVLHSAAPGSSGYSQQAKDEPVAVDEGAYQLAKEMSPGLTRERFAELSKQEAIQLR